MAKMIKLKNNEPTDKINAALAVAIPVPILEYVKENLQREDIIIGEDKIQYFIVLLSAMADLSKEINNSIDIPGILKIDYGNDAMDVELYSADSLFGRIAYLVLDKME